MVNIINKPMDQWDLSDIESLIQNEVRESETIEYKGDRIDNPNRPAKEAFSVSDEDFKKDVCALANSRGGFIFYGINAEKGVPRQIVGITEKAYEDYSLRIRDALATGIEPSLPSFTIKAIHSGEGKCVLVLNISEGVMKPYLPKQDRRFRIRRGEQNQDMSYREIEDMFLNTNMQIERSKAFIQDRIEALENESNKDYLKYKLWPFIVFHIIPLHVITNSRMVYDVQKFVDNYSNWTDKNWIRPNRATLNIDGLFLYSEASKPYAHIHIFRNGSIEVAVTNIFRTANGGYISYIADIRKLIEGVLRITKMCFIDLGVNEPCSIQFSIRNVKNVFVSGGIHTFDENQFDRDNLASMSVILSSLDDSDVLKAYIELQHEFGYCIGIPDFENLRT